MKNKKQFSLRIEEDILKKLKLISIDKDISVSELIVNYIKLGLEHEKNKK